MLQTMTIANEISLHPSGEYRNAEVAPDLLWNLGSWGCVSRNSGIIPPQKQKVPVVTGTHFFTCESYQSSNRLVNNKISSPVWSVAPPFRVASCLGLTFLSRQSGKGHLHWTGYIKL